MYRFIVFFYIVWKYIFIVCYVYKLIKLFFVLGLLNIFGDYDEILESMCE